MVKLLFCFGFEKIVYLAPLFTFFLKKVIFYRYNIQTYNIQ